MNDRAAMDVATTDSTLRDRVQRLFKYLTERSRLRSRVVTDVLNSRSYDPVLWLDELLPVVPEVWSMHRDEPDPSDDSSEEDSGDDTGQLEQELVSVRRVPVPPVPDPPAECVDWIDGGEDSLNRWTDAPPQLLELMLADNPDFDPETDDDIPLHIELRLTDHPSVANVWRAYIEDAWLPWQAERRRLDPVISAYSQLFNLRATAIREEEEYELVIASGVLSWRPEAANSGPVFRHLVTTPVKIELDSQSGTLRIFAEQDTPAPKLETEMLPPSAVPLIDGLPDIEKGEKGESRILVPSPLHGKGVTSVMRPWANRLHAKAVVTSDASQPRRPSQGVPPTISFAPALILRKRPATSMTAAFEQCEQQVREGGEIPFNVARVVEQLVETDGTNEVSAQREEVATEIDSEPLFPMPSNDEQYRIAKRLRRSKGVLVQGPPGTGKTHTIANLICDLLAQGKRILVTSAKARPLMVLHEKLPDEVKPLCLTSLGGGRDEADQLKRSVGGILKHFEQYDGEVNAREVEARTRAIKEDKAGIAKLISERRSRMELETAPQNIAGGTYRGSAMEVIAAVRRDEDRFGWFGDAIHQDMPPTFSASWIEDVIAALLAVPLQAREELRLALPTNTELIDPVEFRELCARRDGLTKDLAEVQESIRENEQQLTIRQREETAPLRNELEHAKAKLLELENMLAADRRRAERIRLRVEQSEKEARAKYQKRLNQVMLDIDRRYDPIQTELRRIQGAQPKRTTPFANRLKRALWDLSSDALTASEPHVSMLSDVVGAMATKGWKWPANAAIESMTGSIDHWRKAEDDTSTASARLPNSEELDRLEDLALRIPTDLVAAPIADDAEERLRFFDAGGSRRFIFKPQVVKRTDYLRDVTVDGVPCSNVSALRELVDYMKAERQLRSLADRWAQVSRRWAQTCIDWDEGKLDRPLVKVATLANQCGAALRQTLESVSAVRQEVAKTATMEADFSVWSSAVQEEIRARQDHRTEYETWKRWSDEVEANAAALSQERSEIAAKLEEELEEAVASLRASIPQVDDSAKVGAAREVELIQGELTEQRERIADYEEGKLAPLRKSSLDIQDELLSIKSRQDRARQAAFQAAHAPRPHHLCSAVVDAIDRGDADAHAAALARIGQLELHRPAYDKLIQLLERLVEIAPKAALHIGSIATEDEVRSIMSGFVQAWAWARANTWVAEFRSRELPKVDDELAKLESAVGDAIAQKAALLAWRYCREAATQKQQEALKAWEKAVKRIGKGKGKYAARHRRQALQHMRVAQGMIPALVSPLPRLVESLPIRAHMFDVVIVDEASQLGPEGVLLFYIGERVVVVGDDEQISPEDVGLDRTQVHALINKYLKEIAVRDSLEESSLFDQADVRFTEGRIMLREHFRCVPEIIAFSNQLAYRDETNNPMLVPLRMVTGDRLRPPLKPVYVPDGFRTPVGVNEPEAEAVVRAISECHADPAYAEKSFGVVSLLGKPQAEHIYRRLVDVLGTEAIEERRIICGDAYSFQGDERDVMYLSMVAANNSAYTSLTARPYKQRFNVAASRARDQMWLFHSVTLSDLRPEDLRYQLLDHCLAAEEHREYLLEDELKKCNNFERAVAQRIWAKGYRVRCQEAVGPYRIDLVVEGSNGNHLAVECDGDRYHPPEQYDDDVRRQRVLERSGWRFWRVWGSDFAADPDGSLDGLWQTLEDLDVGKSS